MSRLELIRCGRLPTCAFLIGALAGCDGRLVYLNRAPPSEPGTNSGSGGAPPNGTCGLATAAFCEPFDTPAPGGRGGDLDESSWSLSRWGHLLEYYWERVPAQSYADRLFPATFCGEPFSGLGPGNDVKVCPGPAPDGTTSAQLNEVFDDNGQLGLNSMRIRRPLDFAGRTASLKWEVDASVNPLNLGHSWWIELWITDDPAPLPSTYPSEASYPRNGLGLSFRTGADCPSTETDWLNGLDSIAVVQDYQAREIPNWLFDDEGDEKCFRVKDTRPNRFGLRLSADRVELWASDWDDAANLRRRAAVSALGLSFTRGYVHLQHGSNSAGLDGRAECGTGAGDLTQCAPPAQTFRWDNVGFDGPTLPLPRVYEVPDNGEPGAGGGVLLGWPLAGGETQTFLLEQVDLAGATSASFNFALSVNAGQTVEVRANDGPLHTLLVPERNGGIGGFSLGVPLAELSAGDNTFEVRLRDPQTGNAVANVDLTLEL